MALPQSQYGPDGARRGGRRSTYRAAVALAAAALAVAGCRAKTDPVLQLVESLRAAAEDRDAATIAARLSDDFRGAGGGADKTEAAASLRRYFAAYESVRVAVYDLSVRRRTETEADLGFRAEFNGAPRHLAGLDGFLPPSAVERFDLRLVRRGADWQVVGADWQPVEPAASPGGPPP
jgi:hypothetical protein